MSDLSKEQLRQLASRGAMARLEELRSEEAAIRQAFPELARKSSSPRVTKRASAAGAKQSEPAQSSNRMSLAARKAVSERMRKYWAERRKAKSAKK